MGQEIVDLIEQVDAQLLVLDADMDVHARDQEPPRHALHVAREDVVAFLVGVRLLRPAREGVGRGGDDGHAARLGGFGDLAAEVLQVFGGIGQRLGDLGADLDLRRDELGHDPAFEPGRQFVHHVLGPGAHEVTGLSIDEVVLLLDADGEGRVVDHDGGPFMMDLIRVSCRCRCRGPALA